MSVEVSSVVWKHAPVDASAMIVLLVLADFADADGGCWPGVDTIADRARCSTRTAQRQLEALSKVGFVKIAYNQGPKGVNRYFVNVEAILAASRTRKTASQAVENQPCNTPESAEKSPVNGPDSSPVGGDNLSPPAGNKVVTSATQVVTRVTGGGDTGVTRTTIEPPIEPPLEREREREAVLEDRQGESQEAKLSKPETGKAALEKRVQRFCSGAGFKAGSWPDWDTGASFGYVASRFEALSEAERETAERWRDAYLSDVARRGKVAVKVGNFLRDRMWEALDPRLLAAFEAAPVVAGAPAQPDGYAPAFGPVWGAWVMARLLGGQEVAGVAFKPDMPAEVRKAWPLLGGLFSEAKCGRGRAFGDKPHALAHLLEAVPVGSAKWDEWMAVWRERGWPVLPDTGNQKVVYLPRDLDAFEAAAKAWQPAIEKLKTMENAA